MENENVVHIDNGNSAVKKNEIMKWMGKWKDMENIMLSVVPRPRKKKMSHVLTHM